MARTGFQRCAAGPGPAAPGFALTRRPGVGSEILLPNTGDVAVLSGSPFGTFGAWTQLQAPLGADVFLSHYYAFRRGIGATIGNALAEFGQGAGPAPLDAARYNEIVGDPTADDVGRYGLMQNTYHTKLPAGSALSARITEASVAQTWRVFAAGWSGAVPTFTPLNVAAATGIGRYYPTNLDDVGIDAISGVLPAWGAWGPVVDPAPNDMLVTHATQVSTSGGVQGSLWAFQFGIGPAGAEADVGTSFTAFEQMPCDIVPPVWLKQGERLSIRAGFLAAAQRGMVIKVVDL